MIRIFAIPALYIRSGPLTITVHWPRTLARETLRTWLCALPMLAAGLVGAAFDEWHHLGLHAWLSLCAAGGLTLGTTLSLQWQLLPTMWIGMAVAAVAQWAWMLASRARHRPGNLGIGHAACMAGMIACGWLCPYLIRPEAGRAGAWLALLCAEAMVLIAVVLAIAIVKRLVESVRTFRLSPATAD